MKRAMCLPARRVGSVINGRLHLRKVLGFGPHGTVYEALNLESSEHVAVKVLAPGFEHPAPALLGATREVWFGGTGVHPHLVTAQTMGRLDDGQLYLTTRIVPGVDLGMVLRAGPVPTATALAFIRHVLVAMRDAHARGIVHGGLKPTNIMVTTTSPLDASEPIQVLDLSLAMLFGARQRVPAPPYAAPEQVRGQLVTAAADCYALGVLLVELTTGMPPASADRRDEGWPDELAFLVWHALQPSPRDRCGTAAEMLVAVEAALRALPRAATIHDDRSCPE